MQCRLTTRYMHLSGELRNMIYRLALVQPRDRVPLCVLDPCIKTKDRFARTPGLLQVCQQIRNEAYPIFLRENRFYLNCIHGGGVEYHDEGENPRFGAWLSVLGSRASMVSNVDCGFSIYADQLLETIKPLDWEPFVLRLSSYQHKDDATNNRPLTNLKHEKIPRINYFKWCTIEEKNVEVERTVASQEEANEALSQLMEPLGADEYLVEDMCSILQKYILATKKFEPRDRILIDLWQVIQLEKQETTSLYTHNRHEE